jgi:hypothetical protein
MPLYIKLKARLEIMVQGMLKAITKRPNYLSVSLYKLKK